MPLFSGIPGATVDTPVTLPGPVLANRSGGSYFCEDGLRNAVNVALLMGQPLLLTGPTGCGKTQLAHAVAAEFRLPLIQSVVRSETRAEDLFYHYDQVARFGDRQNNVLRPDAQYLRFAGLGLGLLRGGGAEAPLSSILSKREESDLAAPAVFGDLAPAEAFDPEGPANSVVLIDELDKAPRDTPNDMLAWIEDMAFDIAELGLRVAIPGSAEGRPAHRPIIIITSNSEKALPDPFLRRCVYYEIPPLGRETLHRIAADAVARAGFDPVIAEDAVDFITRLREQGGLSRPPGTAEFVGWLVLLTERMERPRDRRLFEDVGALENSLAALVKLDVDTEQARRITREWAKDARTRT